MPGAIGAYRANGREQENIQKDFFLMTRLPGMSGKRSTVRPFVSAKRIH
jgi:hypothetical protein